MREAESATDRAYLLISKGSMSFTSFIFYYYYVGKIKGDYWELKEIILEMKNFDDVLFL